MCVCVKIRKVDWPVKISFSSQHMAYHHRVFFVAFVSTCLTPPILSASEVFEPVPYDMWLQKNVLKQQSLRRYRQRFRYIHCGYSAFTDKPFATACEDASLYFSRSLNQTVPVINASVSSEPTCGAFVVEGSGDRRNETPLRARAWDPKAVPWASSGVPSLPRHAT